MKIKLAMVTAIIALTLIAFILSGCTTDKSQTTGNSDKEKTNQVNNTPTSITVGELSKHNSTTDCWIVYKGKVYDITSFIPMHPGGEAVLISKCGKINDFENAFTAKHGISKVDMFFKIAKEKGVLIQNA